VLKLLQLLTAFLCQIQNGLLDTWKAIWKPPQQQAVALPLPLFHQGATSDEGDTDLPTPNPFSTAPFPKVSPAIPAVVWLLETSTNPDVISAAADMAADLQWPVQADLDVVLDRLRDTFWACFIITGPDYAMKIQVRDSSIQHATSCGKAYGTMNIGSRRHNLIEDHFDLVPTIADTTESSQLDIVFNTLKGYYSQCLRTVHTQSDMLWVLRVLPYTFGGSGVFVLALRSMLEYVSASQTVFTNQNYADCLICLNVMLGFKAHPDTIMLKDKRLTHHPLEFSVL
jgi:hypothetical protein